MATKDRTDYWRKRTEARRKARKAERGPRKCPECGKALPPAAHGRARYCSKLCRDRAYYRDHARERIEAVARAQAAHVEERRDYMREYMARRRKAQKAGK